MNWYCLGLKIKRFFVSSVITSLVLQTVAGWSGLLVLAPARAASLTDHLVISEIQISGATTRDEFVELYNPTSSDITMTHWRLTRKTAGGTEYNLVSDLNGIVPAEGFFLIAPSGDYDGTVAQDESYTTSQNIAPDNTVILYSDAGITVVDKVGMGGATDNEGNAGATADNPPDNGSIERRPGADYPDQGNGIDNGDNAADFQVRTIADPQNSSNQIESPNAPSAPTDLTVMDTPNDHGGSITISWNKSVDDGAGKANVTGYNIYRRLSSGTFGDSIGSVSAGTVSYIDKTATNGVDYIYKIEAVDGAYSAFSAESASVTAIDNLPPEISQLTPTDGSYSTNPKPVISAAYSDASAEGLDITSAKIIIDGEDLTAHGAVVSNNKISYTPLLNLTEGQHSVSVSIKDQAGNQAVQNWNFQVDSAAPDLEAILINPDSNNQSASYTGNKQIRVALSGAADAVSGIDKVQLAEDAGFTTNLSEYTYTEAGSTYNYTLTPSNGTKTIYARLIDRAGNISNYVYRQTYLHLGLINTQINTPESQSLPDSHNGLNFESAVYHSSISANAGLSGSVTASIASYQEPPTADFIENMSVVGDYLDFSLDNETALPAILRVYYTQDDLDRAGITEDQIAGLYYYDRETNSWALFDGVVKNTTDVVFENTSYAGFLEVTASHLTPVVIGAYTQSIKGLSVQAHDGSADLTWDAYVGAEGYYVRYKKVDAAEFSSEIKLEGKNNTTTTISGLENGQSYEFQVVAVGQNGAFSASALTTVSLPAVESSQAASSPKVVLAVSQPVAQATPRSNVQTAPIRQPKVETPTPKKEVKSAESEKEVTVTKQDRKRLVIALVILLVAITAGIGGYYGYEWWASQTSSPTARRKGKKTKKKKQNGRW